MELDGSSRSPRGVRSLLRASRHQRRGHRLALHHGHATSRQCHRRECSRRRFLRSWDNCCGHERGSAETDYIGDPLQRSGLPPSTRSLSSSSRSPTTAQGVVAAALADCQNRGDAMFVGTTPQGLDLDGAKAYAASFRGRKVYGALYYPWIQIVNPLDTTGNNPRIFVPPVGHVRNIARMADRGVWKAPARDEPSSPMRWRSMSALPIPITPISSRMAD